MGLSCICRKRYETESALVGPSVGASAFWSCCASSWTYAGGSLIRVLVLLFALTSRRWPPSFPRALSCKCSVLASLGCECAALASLGCDCAVLASLLVH